MFQCDIRGLLAIVNKYKNPFVDSRFFNYVSFWNCEKLKLKYFKYPLTDENAMSKLGRQFIKGDCLSEVYFVFLFGFSFFNNRPKLSK